MVCARGHPLWAVRLAYLTGPGPTCVTMTLAMRKRFHISRRHRLLWTGTVLFCLLFQQLAMAAYVCTLATAPTNVVMAGDCAGMDTGSAAEGSTPPNAGMDPRCAQHCGGNTMSAHDVSPPTVPALVLAAASPTLLGTAAHAAQHQVTLPNTALHRPDRPPMLRFCSLLI